MQEGERDVGRQIGELRHRFHDFGKRGQTAEVAHDQRRHDALAELAQGTAQVVLACDGRCIEVGLHHRCADWLLPMRG